MIKLGQSLQLTLNPVKALCLMNPSWGGWPVEPQDGQSLHFPIFLYLLCQHWGRVGWLKLPWVAAVLKPSSLGGHWPQKVSLIDCLFSCSEYRELFLRLSSWGSVSREGFRCISLRAPVHVAFLFLVTLTNCLDFWLLHLPPLAWINMHAPQIMGSALAVLTKSRV